MVLDVTSTQRATIISSQAIMTDQQEEKNRHCTETTTTKIARYIWLKHCSTTKPHAKLKGERS